MLRQVRDRLRPPPRSLAICHFVETCHVSPPLAGFLIVAFPFLCSGARRRHFSGRRLRPEKSRSWRHTLRCDKRCSLYPRKRTFVGLSEMPVGETILSCLTGSVGIRKRTGKGDAVWYGSGDCYGIYYDKRASRTAFAAAPGKKSC